MLPLCSVSLLAPFYGVAKTKIRPKSNRNQTLWQYHQRRDREVAMVTGSLPAIFANLCAPISNLIKVNHG
jgi:hypothetical protein